ncbi:MAG: prepilin peptidase [Alphaproteobacteria bacterium]|jgi:Flp pilus assembly protein, protease CpaA|nr:prepilin peptidase [Alphaproteobacteria bacterium]MBU0794876.1 prepilin peptidase [Alphaproteobacteria bacterium]MBU0875505.1 prepilin peptidase [Alphaproteobacteria bacterium]MBU1771368.1 prepilin peptidase [Alphaproteobacteria bacterium]
MSGVWISTALSAMLALLLIWGATTDLRSRIISNRLNLAIALLAPFWWWANGLSLYPDIVLQLGLAAAVFALFAGLFALGMMGGGDVKMLGALALWLPLPAMSTLIIVMALAGGVVTIVTVIHHRTTRRIGQPEIPYGVAIALAGLWVLGERYLNPLT